MNMSLITFRSVMPAQRAEAALRRAGIDCHLRRTPRRLQENGCSYSLQVQDRDLRRCVSVLQDRQIDYRRLFRLLEGGRVEEVAL